MAVKFKNTTDHKTLVVGSGQDTTSVEPGETFETTEDEVEGYLERGYGKIVGESSSEDGSSDDDNSSDDEDNDGDEGGDVSEFRTELLQIDGVDDEIADQVEEDFDNFAGFYDAVSSDDDFDLTDYTGVGDVTAEDIREYLSEKVA